MSETFRWGLDEMPKPVKQFSDRNFEVWLVARSGERRWVCPLGFDSREQAEAAALVARGVLGAVNGLAAELEKEEVAA